MYLRIYIIYMCIIQYSRYICLKYTVCVYIYIYIYIYTYIHTYIHTYIYIQLYIHIHNIE